MSSKQVLIDTSVWVDHFRNYNKTLSRILTRDFFVLCHPYVIGELACGYIKARNKILQYLSNLPSASIATLKECLYLIERKKLFGVGIGYVDIHLLASSLTENAELWTVDKKLKKIATSLQINFEP